LDFTKQPAAVLENEKLKNITLKECFLCSKTSLQYWLNKWSQRLDLSSDAYG
jgi:adenine-specific DNA methylase